MGLLAALLAVVLMCVLALQLVNIVRSAQFNEEIARGSLFLIKDRTKQGANQIDEIAARFDANITLKPTYASGLDDYQLERLRAGRPLIDLGATDMRLLAALSHEQLIEIQLNAVTEQQAQATAYMLLEDWQRSGEPAADFIQRMQPHFGYPLTVVPLTTLKLTDSDRARMQYGEVLVRIIIEGSEAEALLRLPGTDSALRLGPIYAFNPYSWQTIGIIALMVAILLGLGVYWVVNSFETRLHKLERATSRLSQGHLNARVAVEANDQVSRLGQTFNQMAEHIQRLISIQREMIRAISHELRTPVARIRFGLQIIEDSVEDAYVTKQLRGMDSDIQELDELIDEILTYARLEEGGPLMDFQRVNIASIAEQVVAEARLPEHVKVIYAGEVPERSLSAEVEPRYIHRAIQNLVGNAARYAKSQVRVVCSVGNDTCRVDVEDDGPGIAKEHWDKVFTAFARLDDSRTRSSGGYGLGLSIVRRIAYWHSGQATVCHSEQLGGACFSLVWPRRHQD